LYSYFSVRYSHRVLDARFVPGSPITDSYSPACYIAAVLTRAADGCTPLLRRLAMDGVSLPFTSRVPYLTLTSRPPRAAELTLVALVALVALVIHGLSLSLRRRFSATGSGCHFIRICVWPVPESVQGRGLACAAYRTAPLELDRDTIKCASDEQYTSWRRWRRYGHQHTTLSSVAIAEPAFCSVSARSSRTKVHVYVSIPLIPRTPFPLIFLAPCFFFAIPSAISFSPSFALAVVSYSFCIIAAGCLSFHR
jgi:hypothetical protein